MEFSPLLRTTIGRSAALLLVFFGLCISAPVTVTRSSPSQAFEGFGSLGAAKPWTDNAPYFDTAFVNMVVGDLGLTIIRDEIPPDFEHVNGDTLSTAINWADYNLVGDIGKHYAYLRALKQKADALGRPLKLIGTVFSPPAWMKSNDSVVNGGTLRTTLYSDFAKYCVAYVKAVKDSTGIDVYGISPQNEPAVSYASSASCAYTTTQLHNLVLAVGPRLRADCPGTLLLSTDDRGDNGTAYRTTYLAAVFGDTASLRYADIMAVHQSPSMPAPLSMTWLTMARQANQCSRPLWCTAASGYTDTWASAWAMAVGTCAALLYGHPSAWLYSQLGAPSADGVEALILDGTPTARYYVCKSFFRYVDPGAASVTASVDASIQGSVSAVAYYSLADSVSTVVLLSTGTSPVNVSLVFPGANPPLSFSVYRTSATQNCVGIGQIAVTDSILLPAQSITTLVGKDTVTQNRPPVIVNTPDSVVVRQGSVVTWTARATDPDGDPVQFTFVPLHGHYVSLVNDSTISLAPATNDSSTTVLVIAHDDRGGSDTLDLRVIVESAVGVKAAGRVAPSSPRLVASPMGVLAVGEGVGSVAIYSTSGRLVQVLRPQQGVALKPGVYLAADASLGASRRSTAVLMVR